MAEQGIKPNIRIMAAVDGCEYYADSGSTAPTNVVDGTVNKGEWLGHTTGWYVYVKGKIMVEFMYETAIKIGFGRVGTQKNWRWVLAEKAAPYEQGNEDWLDYAKATPPKPGQGSATVPPSPDEAETQRLTAEFRRLYTSFPMPEIFKASDGKWYYKFDNGQTAEVAAWAKLTATQQASLSGGKDLGIGFSPTPTGGKEASGKSSNVLIYAGVGLAVLVAGLVLFFNFRKRESGRTSAK